jgi:transketolase
MPNVGLFGEQAADYHDEVLPPSVSCRVAIEAGIGSGWYALAGSQGSVISMDRYGESAPAGQLFEKFGFTTERVTSTVKELLAAG